METVTEVINGKEMRYVRLDSSTCYHEKTPPEVRELLEHYRLTKQRIRVFYGDTETGKDWQEEYYTTVLLTVIFTMQ